MDNVIKMSNSKTLDYTGNHNAALQLVAKIKAYWALRGKDYKVWVEKEKFSEDMYVYNVRSNIPLTT